MKVPRDNRLKSTLDSPKLLHPSKSPSIEQFKSSRSINTKEYIKIDEYEYAQCDLLGTGYTSKVYLGRLINNKRKQVAIKAIDLRRISKQKEHLQLLKQEMHIHQQLDHPNIVKCYKIVEKNNYYYFFLEYCPEGTLDSFIKKHQKLAESTTVTIIEQIISGYQYLLENKVLHRDLKPPNILKSGHNWKICDFGFSVMGKKHLIGNINVGTPAYMAPEALQRTYYSPKTDIFSIGVICYEMLFGKAPWQHKDQKILLTIMQKKISLQTLNSIANRNLIEFITRCCQPHQRRRMSLEQFQQFNFWKQYQPKTTSIKLLEADSEQNSKLTCKTLSTMRDYSLPASSCPSQITNLSTAKHVKKQATEPAFSINKAIIEEDIYICKIILALMKNYTILPLIDDIQKDLYLTVLVRHSNYMLRRIIHNKFNYLSLKKWEDYSSNQHYLSLKAQASDLTQKINALMKAETRRKSIITIRIFNKRYDDLTYDKNLSQKCIENMKEYIYEIMTSLLTKYEPQQKKQVYQTLLYLSKYYKYIKNTPIDDEKSRVVHINQEETSRESVIVEFHEAVISGRQFKKLKDEISKIHL